MKEASDKYLQGKLNSEDEFYSIIGEKTAREERILRAISEVNTKFRE